MTKPESYRIGKVPVHVTSVSDARDRILAAVAAGEKGYVCVSNMRTVVAANRDSAYLDVMEHSLLNVPDGTPLVWCGKAWGLPVERVVGLDLFTALLKAGVPQFFLGDTDETLDAVVTKALSEGSVVAGAYSPPFAPLETTASISARLRGEIVKVLSFSVIASTSENSWKVLSCDALRALMVVWSIGAIFVPVAGSGVSESSELSQLVVNDREVNASSPIA